MVSEHQYHYPAASDHSAMSETGCKIIYYKYQVVFNR